MQIFSNHIEICRKIVNTRYSIIIRWMIKAYSKNDKKIHFCNLQKFFAIQGKWNIPAGQNFTKDPYFFLCKILQGCNSILRNFGQKCVRKGKRVFNERLRTI